LEATKKLGEVVDIRRGKRHLGPKGSKVERAGRLLLPFCSQIRVGDHFRIILGKDIDSERASQGTGQVLIEHLGGEFEVSSRVFDKAPPEQLRTKGDWLAIGRKAIETMAADQHDDLVNGLRLLLTGDFYKSATRLVELRNDYHHRGIDSIRISGKTAEVSTLLDSCFNELAFLVRFPLFRIVDVKFDHGSDKKVHTFEQYVGADPVHDVKSFESDQTYKSSLWVHTVAGPKDLFLFITVRLCPDCSQTETYFLDRSRKNQNWSVKSFERGHSLEAQDVAGALSKWRAASIDPY
jgi:hypothetical protein